MCHLFVIFRPRNEFSYGRDRSPDRSPPRRGKLSGVLHVKKLSIFMVFLLRIIFLMSLLNFVISASFAFPIRELLLPVLEIHIRFAIVVYNQRAEFLITNFVRYYKVDKYIPTFF